MTQVGELKEIETTLERLYEEKGEPCRASLFNFIVWAPSEARAGYLRAQIAKIAEYFPCRILFITQSLDPEQPLLIEVSVNFAGSTACDFIELKTSASQTPHVPYFILPHLLPDLPIFLLWGQDPMIKEPLLDTLYPYASRLIFDSSCVKSLKGFAAQFLDHPDRKFRDANWTLISGWRSVFARIFDTTAKLETLRRCSQVTLSHKGKSSIQAQFFQYWLMAKLHLKPTLFHFQEEEGDGFEGDLLSIDMTSSEGFRYHLYRKGTKVQIHIDHVDTCELPFMMPLVNIQRGFHFWRELLFEGNSNDYLLTLKAMLHE